jgi:hypothetical protein
MHGREELLDAHLRSKAGLHAAGGGTGDRAAGRETTTCGSVLPVPLALLLLLPLSGGPQFYA